MSREEGAEMRKMKMAKGGKAGKYADGGMAEEITVEGRRPQNIDVDLNRMQGTTGGRMGPPAPSSGGGGRSAAPMMEEPLPPRGRMPLARTAGYVGPTADVGGGRMTAGIGPRSSMGVGYERKFKDGGKVQTSSDTARKLATEMGGYKKGGKVKQIDVDMKGLEEMSRPRASLPKADLESKVMEGRNLAATRKREAEETAPKKQSFGEAFAAARKRGDKTFSWNGGSYGTQLKGETTKSARAPTRAAATPSTKGMSDSDIRNFMSENDKAADASKASSPSAPREPTVGLRNTKIGSAYADVLDKERAANAKSNKELVERYKKEGRPRLAKIASFLSGAEYAKGGKVKGAKPKDGLAVMIAIGSPKKPTKKMNGGPMAARSTDMEASKVTRGMAMGGSPDGYAAGGVGKMRKGMMPDKFAQGGAGKVRKGMMTPEGNIIKAMNKMRGK
jgi:hypothetical protein